MRIVGIERHRAASTIGHRCDRETCSRRWSYRFSNPSQTGLARSPISFSFDPARCRSIPLDADDFETLRPFAVGFGVATVTATPLATRRKSIWRELWELDLESKCWGAVEIPENPPSSIFELSIYLPITTLVVATPLWMALSAEVLLIHTHVRCVSNR